HRLVHLWLDLLAKQHPPFFEHFIDARTQFTSLGIDDLKLLFNTQSEFVVECHNTPKGRGRWSVASGRWQLQKPKRKRGHGCPPLRSGYCHHRPPTTDH